MKKSFLKTITGFTLAEVLITLTIIGVIAALTIPSLITNIQDAQYKTAWKKEFSDLNQVVNRIKLDNGGTLNGVFQNDSDTVNKFASYLSTTKACPNWGGGCWHNANNWYMLNTSAINWGNNTGLILNNGSLLILGSYAQDCSDTAHTGSATFPICGSIYVDTNGFKGPNTIGKDIYAMWITQNGLSPLGYKDAYTSTCNSSSSGQSCATQYLMQ